MRMERRGRLGGQMSNRWLRLANLIFFPAKPTGVQSVRTKLRNLPTTKPKRRAEPDWMAPPEDTMQDGGHSHWVSVWCIVGMCSTVQYISLLRRVVGAGSAPTGAQGSRRSKVGFADRDRSPAPKPYRDNNNNNNSNPCPALPAHEWSRFSRGRMSHTRTSSDVYGYRVRALYGLCCR